MIFPKTDLGSIIFQIYIYIQQQKCDSVLFVLTYIHYKSQNLFNFHLEWNTEKKLLPGSQKSISRNYAWPWYVSIELSIEGKVLAER